MPYTERRRSEQNREHNGSTERRGQWDAQRAQSAARDFREKVKPSTPVSSHEERLAHGLGWFSLGIGLAELFAPQAIARFLGIRHQETLIRLIGLREIASGIGILTDRRPARWLWVRAASHVADTAGLGMALNSTTAKSANSALAAATLAGVTALDVWCALKSSRTDEAAMETHTARVRKSIQINRSPVEVYKFWRDFQNLPRFTSNLESVQLISDRRSHWVATGPAGRRIQWDAEIVEDHENQLIAWRSLEGADVEHYGSVRFEAAPGDRGTFIKVEILYSPPVGVLGTTVAKLFGRAPDQQVHEDLLHLKQILETGEIITTEGQPAGRASSTSWKFDHTIRRQSRSASANQRSADLVSDLQKTTD